MTAPLDAGRETALATYEFRRGGLRGSHLALYPTRLVHRGDDFFEVMPLDHVGALRAGFERDAARMNWGGVLGVIALLVLGSYWPLRALVAIAFGEMNPQSQGGGAFLPTALQAMDLAVGLIPPLSAIFALWGVVLFGFAWYGDSVLTLAVGNVERSFATPGRDPDLFTFAESVSVQLDSAR